MIVVDMRLEDKTEEEVTAYYSQYYAKIWGKLLPMDVTESGITSVPVRPVQL